jgi:hypothetical protein
MPTSVATATSPKSSTFPHFADGDTLIVLSANHTYRLHSSVLRTGSTYFAKELAEENGAQLTKKARDHGVTLRYHMQLLPPREEGTMQVGKKRKSVHRTGNVPAGASTDVVGPNESEPTDSVAEEQFKTGRLTRIASFSRFDFTHFKSLIKC